ncbi:MAG: acyl-[ACP]--phospholipid O-acyltransferase [Vicinamibacterales bacterium]
MTAGSYRSTLARPGLQAFLWTQFLGAFNDNVFRIAVSLVAVDALGLERGAAAVGAVFVLPFLLFSGWAGHLADRHGKHRVLVVTKGLEVVAMALAVPALVTSRLDLLLVVLFLMAAQSTFFSPAKYGIVPELLPARDLSRANGLLEMSTFAAIVLGTGAGGALFDAWRDTPWRLAAVLVAIAVAGLLTSLRIPAVPAARPDRRFALDPWHEIGRGVRRVWPDRTLRLTIVGLSYFWFLGALLQMALIPFGREALGVGDAASTRLYTPLAIGIAAGSLLAGRLSGRKIELGLVPLGSFGLGVFSLAFAGAASYGGAALVLGALGVAGGFFAVPLNALVQHRPAEDEKGRVLGTTGFLNTIGILLASAVLWASDAAGLSIRQLLAVVAAFTLASNVYVLAKVPDFFVRFVLWGLTHTIYRIRIVGRPNVPERGPALIVANHVSLVDGALVGATIQRFVRFLVFGPYFRRPGLHALLTRMHAIPVETGRRRGVADAIARARAELEAGHVVCIFAEGAVSRTGNLLPFKRGFERIVAGLDVPIVPVYLDRVWGSIFSFKRERFLWKRPERLPYPVTVAWGAPLPSTATALEVRQAIMELGSDTVAGRRPPTARLHTEFYRMARRRWGAPAMADSTGQRLTYGRAMAASLLMGEAIARRAPGEPRIGLLLPASVGGALANIAVLGAGRVPVNLNFTVGPEALDAAIAQAGLRTIVTSRTFLDKAGVSARPGFVYLEDLRRQFGAAARLRAIALARLAPLSWLGRRHRVDAGADPAVPSDRAVATIVFSSGSTGQPKGVMISHAGILANTDALAQIFPMTTADGFIGVLPFFHSFGLTGTLWFPLLQGARVIYHPNPMDAKRIGELAAEHRATMLISTPTFCQAYVRRITPEQFGTLKYAIVGAEKLREPVAAAFRQAFGVSLMEGYGCTEMSPVVAVNRPDVADPEAPQTGTKAGSVGHPVPGVSAMVVDRETGEGPIVGQEGLLLVRGPNLMLGYLDDPGRTAEVIRDGWYVTGDLARIDEDGFIFITDRLSRFSKIGGEMVPHLRVEDAINEVLGEACSAVTAVSDDARGERLVAFYACPGVTPAELWDRLNATSLPKLWLPRRDSLVPIATIPTLGTGKVDLRRLREMGSGLGSQPRRAAADEIVGHRPDATYIFVSARPSRLRSKT